MSHAWITARSCGIPKGTRQRCCEFLLLCFVVILGPVEARCILREMVACIVLVQPCSSIFVSSFSSKRRALVCSVSISVSVLDRHLFNRLEPLEYILCFGDGFYCRCWYTVFDYSFGRTDRICCSGCCCICYKFVNIRHKKGNHHWDSSGLVKCVVVGVFRAFSIVFVLRSFRVLLYFVVPTIQ